MSYTYGFFDAVDLGSGNYDRVYSSAEFSHYWALLVGDGVFGQPSTSLNVLATTPVAMSVKVSPGTGWIKGHYLTVPDNMDEVIAVPVANPSLPRIDSIIMALDNTDRMMKLYVRSGTAAASPQPVSLQRDADIWELELAQVTVAAGAGNITQAAIKDMRTNSTRCGIVTGLVDQFDVTGFFTAAQASFDEWFENVQNQLGDDVAGNLLNLINGLQDSKVNISDKATEEEAKGLQDNTKWITPLRLGQALPWSSFNKKLLLKTTTSKTFSIPEGIHFIDLYVTGGGGGGCKGTWACGAGGGYCKLYRNIPVTPGQVVSITIGAGGSPSQTESVRGGTGGTTTVSIGGRSYTAAGGKGGIGNNKNGADGGSAGGPAINSRSISYGGENGKSTEAGTGGGPEDYTPVNPYNGILYGCGGGGGDTNGDGYSIGGGLSGGVGTSSSTVNGGEGSGGGSMSYDDGGACGNGGPGGGGGASTRAGTAAGAGGPGICFIYGV